MTSPRRRAVGLALALTLCLLCLGAAGAASASATQPAAAQNETADPGVDTTVTRISLAENGTARWTIEIRTRLDDAESVEEYEAYQERFRENRSRYREQFRDRMSTVVENAETTTGREMSADGFAAETSIQEVPRRWGVVTYSFRWRGFAATDGDAVVGGDALEGGFYLADGDSLVIEAPSGYEVATTSPPPDETDDGDPVWTGRRDFGDREPAVETRPATATTDAEAAQADAGSAAGGGAFPVADVALAMLGLCAVAGLAYAGLRGGLPSPISPSSSGENGAASGDDTAPPTGDGELSTGDGEASASPPEDDTSRGGEVTVSADADGGTGDLGGDAGPNADLLTDEDRVETLLAENGGRLKQQQIVDELGWSASKTSRVLSDMADDGTVEKLRIGRENVIDLADD